MKDLMAQVRQAALYYRVTLEKGAQVEEGIASTLAMIADEMDRQGQSQIAEMFQQTSHRHRVGSIKSRAHRCFVVRA